MIQIARVDYPRLPSEFDFLRVERIGGIAGVHERLSIERIDSMLQAAVRAHVQEPQEFLLDANQAERVLATCEELGSRGSGADGAEEAQRGADMFQYVVEVGWAGTVSRYVVHGVPGDDALHGVLEFASAVWAGEHRPAN